MTEETAIHGGAAKNGSAKSGGALAADAAICRPFYFMTWFWGERYRRYLVDLCLPALMAPANLPLLRAQDGHRYLIATTREDWQAIESLPIMARLRQYVTPSLLEISKPQIDSNAADLIRYAANLSHQNLCLKMLLAGAYAAKSYGCLVMPDLMFSDGTVASLLRSARAGQHLVMLPALRQVEETVLAELTERGVLSAGSPASLTGEAIVLPQRMVADIAVRHLHPEIWVFDESNPAQPFPPPFRYWRMPEDRGLLLHTFFGLPVLMDFAVVSENHTACLDQEAFENIYVGKNFSHCGGVRIVQDSDEFSLLSLTPGSVNWAQNLGDRNLMSWLRNYDRLCSIRGAMHFYAGRKHDVVSRDLFLLPIRWHARDIDESWHKKERQITRLIHRAVGDYSRVSRPPNLHRFPARPSLNPRFLRIDLALSLNYQMLREIYFRRRIILRRISRAVRGDPAARRWVVWRIKVLRLQIAGRTEYPPMPELSE